MNFNSFVFIYVKTGFHELFAQIIYKKLKSTNKQQTKQVKNRFTYLYITNIYLFNYRYLFFVYKIIQ